MADMVRVLMLRTEFYNACRLWAGESAYLTRDVAVRWASLGVVKVLDDDSLMRDVVTSQRTYDVVAASVQHVLGGLRDTRNRPFTGRTTQGMARGYDWRRYGALVPFSAPVLAMAV